MLSFRTAHAITGELMAAANSTSWSTYPVLLLIQDRPIPQPDAPDARHLRVTSTELAEHLWTQHPGGVPGVLDDLAHGGIDRLHPQPYRDDSFGPDARTLAVAVCYDDILTDPDTDSVAAIRRVDAVDADGRVYQTTRLPGQGAFVVVDDEPDPHDTPATQPGLHALLDALGRQPAA
jgi:hypothetical protein